MDNNVKFAVIPAAGVGSRWAPLSSFVPKEMLPLGGVPVIQLVVQEVVESGCSDAILVISKKKELVRDYLVSIKEFESKINFHFVYQEEPLGVADSIYRAKDLIAEENFAVVFPDHPGYYKRPPLGQMLEVFRDLPAGSHLISFAKYPENNMLFYGEFKLQKREDDLYDVIHLCPKAKNPSESHHPESNLRGAGRYVFSASMFPLVERVLREVKDREVWDGDFLNLAFRLKHEILGIEVDGSMLEIGTPSSYTEANYRVHNFLKAKY